MPNIKSAKKRVLVSAVKTAKNQANRSALKTQIKKAYAVVDSDAAEKEAVVRSTIKSIDQAAAKGLLHKNTAARKKSALAKKVQA